MSIVELAAPTQAQATPRQVAPVVFLLLIFMLSQVFATVTLQPVPIRLIDALGPFFLATYVFLRLNGRRAVGSVETYLIALIFCALLVSLSGSVLIMLDSRFGNNFGLIQYLYVARFIFSLSPALLAFCLPLNERSVGLWVCVSLVFGFAFLVFMMLQYSGNQRLYGAHQSIILIEGAYTFFHQRFGGLVGETGAIAMHANFIYFGMVLSLFLLRFHFAAKTLVLIYPFFMLWFFSLNHARIFVGSGLIMMFWIVLSRGVFSLGAKFSFLIICAMLFFAMIVFDPSLSGFDPRLLGRMITVLEGRDLNEVTTGRLDNWAVSLGFFFENPLGYGYRNLSVITERAVENFFVRGITEYGILFFPVQVLFLLKLFAALKFDGASPTDGLAKASVVARAMAVGFFLQWQVNDIDTYHQTFPATLLLLVLVARLVEQRRRHVL